MIYLNNSTDAQRVYLPDFGISDRSSAYCLTLRSTVERRAVWMNDAATPAAGSYALVIPFAVTLPEGLADGEYVLELSQENERVSIVLVQVGDYERIPVEAADEQILKFRQYGG